jgi:hypothetical protein
VTPILIAAVNIVVDEGPGIVVSPLVMVRPPVLIVVRGTILCKLLVREPYAILV